MKERTLRLSKKGPSTAKINGPPAAQNIARLAWRRRPLATNQAKVTPAAGRRSSLCFWEVVA